MAPDPSRSIEAVIFDKDGTLVDFHSTWDDALGKTIDGLLADRPEDRKAVAAGLGFDLATRTILTDAPFVAESGETLAKVIAPYVNPDEFEARLISEGAGSANAMTGALDTLTWLSQRGIKLGVATNDAEVSAHKQLEGLGWGSVFDAILGYDSGFSAKPSPKMLLGCCQRLGVDPENAVMVGDTATDMRAARSAGIISVLIGSDDAGRAMADHCIDGLGELIDLFFGS